MRHYREEEIANFVAVAKKYGCGSKWGLFASHIPHRVAGSCPFHRTIEYSLFASSLHPRFEECVVKQVTGDRDKRNVYETGGE